MIRRGQAPIRSRSVRPVRASSGADESTHRHEAGGQQGQTPEDHHLILANKAAHPSSLWATVCQTAAPEGRLSTAACISDGGTAYWYFVEDTALQVLPPAEALSVETAQTAVQRIQRSPT